MSTSLFHDCRKLARAFVVSGPAGQLLIVVLVLIAWLAGSFRWFWLGASCGPAPKGNGFVHS